MKEKKEVYVSVFEKKWKDLKDNDFIYKPGDIFPREGLEVDKKRLKELSTKNNKIGEVLIKKIEIEDNSEELDKNENSGVEGESDENATGNDGEENN